jgi:hypothetical protein
MSACNTYVHTFMKYLVAGLDFFITCRVFAVGVGFNLCQAYKAGEPLRKVKRRVGLDLRISKCDDDL